MGETKILYQNWRIDMAATWQEFDDKRNHEQRSEIDLLVSFCTERCERNVHKVKIKMEEVPQIWFPAWPDGVSNGMFVHDIVD